jgi:hypothetical protein
MIKDEIFKNILQINWFKYEDHRGYDYQWYIRDDWYCIIYKGKEIHIINWSWDLILCRNKSECIWQLALRQIINRLF